MRFNTRKIDDSWEFKPKSICNLGTGAAIIGGSVISGLMGADAAQSAANTQAGAADRASQASLAATTQGNQLTAGIYNQNLANQAPFLQGQQIGEAALLGALGLGNLGAGTSSGSNYLGGGYVPTAGGGVQQQLTGGPSTGATGSLVAGPANGGTNIPGVGTIGGNYGATQSQLNAAEQATSGLNLGKLASASDVMSQMNPEMQFIIDQGNQGLKASLAATGDLQTGQGLKDISNYNTNMGNSFYQNAFDNLTTQKNNIFNYLSGLSGNGSTAGSISNAGTNAASNISQNTQAGTTASNNYLTSGAAASAAGQVGSVNALTGAFNGGLNAYMGNQFLSGIGKTGTVGTGDGAASYTPTTNYLGTGSLGPGTRGYTPALQ